MFKVGDKVRVKAEVKNPRYSWGAYVNHYSVGVVVTAPKGNGYMLVDFPYKARWIAHAPEMELIKDKPKAKKPKPKVEANNPPKKPFTAKDIHNRPVYAQLKASAVDARTLTKLVKAYLANLNSEANAEERFMYRTANVINSFGWLGANGGGELWERVHKGRPVKFEDIKPEAIKEVKAPQQAPVVEPKIGRGERPEGATHWNVKYERWLKLADDGVVFWWSVDLGNHWVIYNSQMVGRERIRNAIALEPVVEMLVVKGQPNIGAWAADFEALEQRVVKRGQPKPVVEQTAQEVKEPAPRIGWW